MTRYLTTTQAAEKLGISREWLYVLASKRRVQPHALIGTAYGWDPDRLEEIRKAIPTPFVHVHREQK